MTLPVPRQVGQVCCTLKKPGASAPRPRCCRCRRFDLGAGLGTRALAGVARSQLGIRICESLPLAASVQRDFHGVGQVAATEHLAATGTTTTTRALAEHVAKDVAKGFGKATKALAGTARMLVNPAWPCWS